jgi:activator of HSP90 ATPase
MSNRIHQEVVIHAEVPRVYAALTDAEEFRAMSQGAPTQIVATAGGAFACFGGMIVGYNLELLPGERVVQAWRVKLWPAGEYSTAKFELRPEGKGTRVALEHWGFPEGQEEHLAAGWHKNYWEPMRKHLGG